MPGEKFSPSFKAVDTERLNNAQTVLPDGTNDAQKVIDAINDRSGTEPVVIFDPGIPLDWEQQVNLPADEYGFTLDTVGRPTLSIPSGFSGSYAIEKPSSTAGNDSLRGYHIGSFQIDDETNTQLSYGVSLSDIKDSYVAPIEFLDCPGIDLNSPNTTSADNVFEKPTFKTTRGPGLNIDTNSHANVFRKAFFDDKGANTETAFLDRGDQNHHLDSRVEFCGTVHTFDGSTAYYVREGDWDRLGDYTTVIEERNGASGTIETVQSAQTLFEKSIIANRKTTFRYHDRGPHDLFANLENITPLTTPAMVNLEQRASAGSLTVEGSGGTTRTVLRVESGSVSSDAARVGQGGNAFFITEDPKLCISVFPDQASDTTAVLARLGIHQNDTNYSEFIYDPTNTLGGHTADNWYYELVTGGTTRTSTDTGIAPSGGTTQTFSLNRSGATDEWWAHIDGSEVAQTGNGGNSLGQSEFYFELETQEDANKTWNINPRFGARLWLKGI